MYNVSTLNLPLKAGNTIYMKLEKSSWQNTGNLHPINSDEYFDALSISELQNRLSIWGELDEKMGVDEMKKLMKN